MKNRNQRDALPNGIHNKNLISAGLPTQIKPAATISQTIVCRIMKKRSLTQPTSGPTLTDVDPEVLQLHSRLILRRHGLSKEDVYKLRRQLKVKRENIDSVLTINLCLQVLRARTKVEDLSAKFQFSVSSIQNHYKKLGLQKLPHRRAAEFNKDALQVALDSGFMDWEIYLQFALSAPQLSYFKRCVGKRKNTNQVLVSETDRRFFEEEYVVKGRKLIHIEKSTGISVDYWETVRKRLKIPKHQ